MLSSKPRVSTAYNPRRKRTYAPNRSESAKPTIYRIPVGYRGRKIPVFAPVFPREEIQRIRNEGEPDFVVQAFKIQPDPEQSRLKEESKKVKEKFKPLDDRNTRLPDRPALEDDKIGIRERAFLAKQEEEEEVKRANKIILAAKCHVIREAQIAEKNDIARELRDEELRLETIMEEERLKAINEEDSKLKNLKEYNNKYIVEVRKQLEDRESRRALEAERIKREAKMNELAELAIKRDEETKAKIKHERRSKIRSDLQQISELSATFKKLEFEQQRLAEMKVQQYMKQKEEREKKRELEKKLAKEAFEKKQEYMVTILQGKIQTKSLQEEMTTRVEQEEKEREFRRREREAALRRKQMEHDLREARLKQIAEMRERKALEIEEDEAHFRVFCEELKKEQAKEKQLEEMDVTKRKRYREEILTQIFERKRDFDRIREEARREHQRKIMEEKQRDQTIRAVIQAKVNAMRRANMPEKFIKDVEKQLKVSNGERGSTE